VPRLLLLPQRARSINVLARDRLEEFADDISSRHRPLFDPLVFIEFAIGTDMTLLLAARAFSALWWHSPVRDRFFRKVSRTKLFWQTGWIWQGGQ
jgi:hypothetical protein